MGWKKFYKPTIVKIVLGLIFLLFLPIWIENNCLNMDSKNCSALIYIGLDIITGEYPLSSVPTNGLFYLDIIIAYTCASTIMLLYNKFFIKEVSKKD